jgi:hypothetical protein
VANEQQPDQQLSAQGAARRRFTRAGAAASGVLLTLHSQPGMAQVICASPSGFQSGLISARPNDPGACVGRTPGYWKNVPDKGSFKAGKSYPAGANPTDLFSSVFFCTMEMDSTYGSKTCTLDFIMSTEQSWDKHNLGAHLVAAYLNVLAGFSQFQTVPMLKNIWNELRDKGYFTPTAGVKWDSAQVVDYLKGTMPL